MARRQSEEVEIRLLGARIEGGPLRLRLEFVEDESNVIASVVSDQGTHASITGHITATAAMKRTTLTWRKKA